MCKLRHVIADNNIPKHNQKDVATTTTTFLTCTVDLASYIYIYITPVNFGAFHTMDSCNFLTTPHNKKTNLGKEIESHDNIMKTPSNFPAAN